MQAREHGAARAARRREGQSLLSPKVVHKLPSDARSGGEEKQDYGPARADEQAATVLAVARCRNDQVGELDRELQDVQPFGVLLEASRRDHVVHARDGGEALIESNHTLDLELHPCIFP
eukprot:2989251-Prymnesium_polylepis.1